MLSLIHRPNT